MLQHLRGVHVLPPAFANIYSTDFIVAGHQPNSISEAAITLAAAGLRSFEIFEDFEWANKQPDINGIVIAQFFPDVGDSVSPCSDFHRVFQIEDGIEFLVYPDVKEIGIERSEQTIDDGIVEKMVAHREKKGFVETVSGGKKRDAILFLPVAVFDEGGAEAGRNQLLDLCDHALAFVAERKVDACDPCADQGI